MNIIKSISVAMMAFGLTACANNFAVPEVQKAASALAPSYVINAGDTIDIKFFYTKELNDSVTVRPDGYISLQLVDDVKVAELTPKEIDDKLTALYAKKLGRGADLSVIIKGFESQRVYVVGEVDRAGELKLNDKMTALQAITAAGGFKNSADKDEVLIVRQKEDGTSETFKANFSDSSIATATTSTAHMQLQPRDLIYVPKSGVAKTNQFVDQYVRQMLMFNGFSGGVTAIYDLNNSNRGF